MTYTETLFLFFLGSCFPSILIGVLSYIIDRPKKPSKKVLIRHIRRLAEENRILKTTNDKLQAELRRKK